MCCIDTSLLNNNQVPLTCSLTKEDQKCTQRHKTQLNELFYIKNRQTKRIQRIKKKKKKHKPNIHVVLREICVAFLWRFSCRTNFFISCVCAKTFPVSLIQTFGQFVFLRPLDCGFLCKGHGSHFSRDVTLF